MQANRNPLLVEDSSVIERNKIKRGASRRYDLLVKNISEKEEVSVNFWIETPDQKSEPLLGWYSFEETAPLKIRQGDRYTVPLIFEIPQQATPNTYNYVLVFETAQHPEAPFRRPLQLQVEASEQDLELDIQPSFTVAPHTTAELPHSLQAGESFSVTVTVENRSKQTDRFYLTCPELPNDWYTVGYPAGAIERYGFEQDTDGLPLNPKDQGEITLRFHLPLYTPAGNYHPTLQLTSKIKEELALLDVVYLQLLPNEQLSIQLQPELRLIPEDPGEFALTLTNTGNIQRKVTIRATDQNKRFAYDINPPVIELVPGKTEQTQLRATPKKWWRRPLRGKPLEFDFDLTLDNTPFPFLPEPTHLPTLPETLPHGKIIWQPRPWWVLASLILAALLAIAAISLYLWRNILRPPDTPEITAFSITDGDKEPIRQEGKKNALLRLTWQIKHFEYVHRITIIRIEKGIETDRKTYFFGVPIPGSIPDHLLKGKDLKGKDQTNNFCEQQPNTTEKPRSHLALLPSPVLGIPYPTLKPVSPALLTCNGITTGTKEAGNYTFQIQVFTSPQQKEPVATQTTDTIVIKPADDPKIVSFAPTQLVYQEGQLPGLSLIQPGTAQSNLPQSQFSPISPRGVQLNWAIANTSRVKEIILTSTAPDGSTQSEAKRYILPDRDGLPVELSGICVRNRDLVCRNVQTDVKRPGNYVFKLTAIVKQEKGTTEITRTTEPVKITPKELQILSFQVNGQDARSKPKHVYMLSDRADKVEIVLSWNVLGGEDMQVELSPSPGKVPARGRINYSLSPPNAETITLKVSNKSGAQISQSVVIQTIEAPPLDLPLIQPASPKTKFSPPSPRSSSLSPIETSP